LNASVENIFQAVVAHIAYYNLLNDGKAVETKQIIMPDHYSGNKQIAEAIPGNNKAFLGYQVWQTDHYFPNKPVALMKRCWRFLLNKSSVQHYPIAILEMDLNSIFLLCFPTVAITRTTNTTTS
jgi:hypothetical protein